MFLVACFLCATAIAHSFEVSVLTTNKEFGKSKKNGVNTFDLPNVYQVAGKCNSVCKCAFTYGEAGPEMMMVIAGRNHEAQSLEYKNRETCDARIDPIKFFGKNFPDNGFEMKSYVAVPESPLETGMISIVLPRPEETSRRGSAVAFGLEHKININLQALVHCTKKCVCQLKYSDSQENVKCDGTMPSSMWGYKKCPVTIDQDDNEPPTVSCTVGSSDKAVRRDSTDSDSTSASFVDGKVHAFYPI